jgi:SulP family sulfate permease
MTYFPIIKWLKNYNQSAFSADLMAALVVTIMLIPQSLAYALLAGVPAEVGLYSCLLPLVFYAIFGSSRTLSVGPVAITSLMTAVALGEVVGEGAADYLTAAISLAFLSGILLCVLGLLRLGFLANFLSGPVVSGFVTASGILIGISQIKHILGVSVQGDTLPELLPSLSNQLTYSNAYTLLLGSTCLLFLFLVHRYGVKLLTALSVSNYVAKTLSKAAPIITVMATIAVAHSFDLVDKGLEIVGTIPRGLPSLTLNFFDAALLKSLFIPASLIAIIGYVGSISVAKTLATKRKQKIDSNQELIGLGASNIASACSGGIPVSGGFSRSVVNFDAGAKTQMAGIFTAIFIALIALYLTPILYYLPKATLAATIIISVISLIDFSIFRKTWRYDKSDFLGVTITLFVTLLLGVELGVSCGVLSSICLHLYRTSRPHIAEVGLVEGSEHFRNVERFHVTTLPEMLTIRVDESLFFANASYLEDTIYSRVFDNDHIAHVVLMCSAVNEIDYSALEVIEAINSRLIEQGVCLHMSEVKGPVFDALEHSGFLERLSGKVFISQYRAFQTIKELI